MHCPVCDTETRDDATECGSCGKVLQPPGDDPFADAPPIEGIERTRLEEDAGAQPQWTAGPLELEPTAIQADAAATSSWTGEVEIDRGRDEDADPRTPAPSETATCPFCGVASLEAVCDGCGRRKVYYAAERERAPQLAAGGEAVTCPSCFARVAKDARCSECGLPFPVQEL